MVRSLRGLAATFAIVLGIGAASGQSVLWQKDWGRKLPGIEGNFKILSDNRGGLYLVSNYLGDIYVARMNADSAVLWEARLDTENSNVETCTDAVVDRNGDLVLCGSTNVLLPFSSDAPHGYLAKVRSDGATAWSTVVADSPYISWQDSSYNFKNVFIDRNGNPVVVGTLYRADGNNPWVLSTTLFAFDDSTGTYRWKKEFLPEGFNFSKAFADGAGRIILAGSQYSSAGFQALAVNDLDGSLLWKYVRPGGNPGYTEPTDMALTRDGGLVMVGFEWTSTRHVGAAIRINTATGIPSWFHEEPVTSSDQQFLSVRIGEDGNPVTVFSPDSWATPQVIGLSGSTGERLWTSSVPSNFSPIGLAGSATKLFLFGRELRTGTTSTYDTSIKEVGSNGALGAASVTLPNFSFGYKMPGYDPQDFFVADPAGSWTVYGTFNNATYVQPLSQALQPTGGGSPATSFPVEEHTMESATSPDGSIATFGAETYPATVATFSLFDAAGARKWTTYLNPSLVGSPCHVGRFSNGDVLIAAASSVDTSTFYLIRLKAADGTVVYGRSLSKSQTFERIPAIQVLADDSVLGQFSGELRLFSGTDGSQTWSRAVTGTILPGTTNGDLYLMAVDSNTWITTVTRVRINDGATVWTRSNKFDPYDANWTVSAIAPNGDLILAGDYNNSPYPQWANVAVVRLSGSSGAVLWTQKYDGGNSVDHVDRLAVDSYGNVVVVGTRYYDSSQRDLQVVELRAGDGTVAWSQWADSAEHGNDEVAGLTLDPFGNPTVAMHRVTGKNGRMGGGEVLRFDRNNGGIRWRAMVAPTGTRDADITSVTTAPDGNFLVAGSALEYGSDRTDYNYMAAKLKLDAHWTRTFSAKVALEDYVGDVTKVPVTVIFQADNTSFEIGRATVYPDAQGNITLPIALPDEKYDILIKAPHWLAKKIRGINTTAVESISLGALSLINGDVNGDNQITATDNSILSTAYRSRSTSANWDPRADLNGDGQVSATDASILSRNFRKKGDS